MDETTTTKTTKRQLTSLSSSSDHANMPLPILPFDMIAEILCRLPVKLLLQLRCLCKFFNTLISDSKFAKKHLRMSTTTHHLIYTCEDGSHVISYPLHSLFNSVTTINTTHLYFPFEQQCYFIIGSCDGILCLTSLSSSSDHANMPLPILPFDLIAEILCRLPVKLLLQLRCLCKFFNTLISDSKFAKKHLRMSTTTHHLIYTCEDGSHVISYPLHSLFNSVTTINTTHLYFPFEQQCYFIVGSCDGILCLVVNECSIILWNPSIRKFTRLPSFESPIKVPTSDIAYGFGYDPLIDNYKVVALGYCLISGNGIPEPKIKVHTLGTNSWRMIKGNFPVPVEQSLKFVSGTFNWSQYTDDGYRVVSFDLVNESYRQLLPPNYGPENVNDANLGVLRDCLCIFVRSPTFSSVWLMKEYGNEESWTKLFRVPYTEDPFFYPYIEPIWLSGDDQVLMECLALQKSNLAIYRFKNDTLKISIIQNMDFWFNSKVCVESLISPCF